MKQQLFKLVWALMLFMAFASSARSQTEQPSKEFVEVEEIIVLGTRVEGKTLSESTVPVEIISEKEILATGHTEIGRIIQTLVASFNFSSSTISDGTDSVRPATLKGLGPDQVLVLVNGKRRHRSALIHVNTSVGRGTSGYDMNSIPVASIKRIEILHDGAAAQYGSDAVAGVINIILKDGTDEGRVFSSYGKTYESDGDTYVASIGKGITFKNGGYLFASFEYRKRERTNRAGKSGQIQYPSAANNTSDTNRPTTAFFTVGDSTLPTGFSAPAFGGTATEINNEAIARRFSNGDKILSENSEEERDFDRINFRIGDSESEQFSGALNFFQPIGNNTEVAAWVIGSPRENLSGGFYRRADQLDRNPLNSDYPHGFLPLIEPLIDDLSGAVRITHDFGKNSVDLSIGGGFNQFSFNIKNSHNASFINCLRNFATLTMVQQETCTSNNVVANSNGIIPNSADAGELVNGLFDVNLDFRHPLDWGHLAWGIDYRRDIYKINAGEEYSYRDFDGAGGGSAGIQVFPGFQPQNEVDETRHAFGIYADFEKTISDILIIHPSIRAEHYSDFGATLNGKLDAKVNPLPWLAFRGSVSSGFRAPSMQQLYFNNISTQFVTEMNTIVSREVGTFRNNSTLARNLGIPQLKEEQSINIGSGFVLNPSPNLSLSADFYWIRVNDRIIISGRVTDKTEGVSRELLGDVDTAQFFMNAADTETRGVDISASYRLGFYNDSTLNLLLKGTINETEIKSVNIPAGLPDELFTEQDRSIIESWQPKDRWTLLLTYEWKIVTATLATHRYGEYTVIDGRTQTYGAKYLNDMQLGFDLDSLGILKIGANNIFDVKPDRNLIGQSRFGTIYDHEGNLVVDSPGVFQYSRRSAPFGFNGGFYYISWEKEF